MEDVVDRAVAGARFNTVLLAIFARRGVSCWRRWASTA